MEYKRAKVHFETNSEIANFVKDINAHESNNWILENFDGSFAVNAGSLLGVIYAATEWTDGIYLVNVELKSFPAFVDKYRA